MMDDFGILERFERSIDKFGLSGKVLRVAVSGGSDSIALLMLCHSINREFELRALHIIHNIRPECIEETEFVKTTCEELGIPLDIISVNTPAHSESQKIGLEEAGRDMRYRVFKECVQRGEVVATAHTADDVVETLMFNLARGTGPRGLAGIPKERDGIIRPMLEFHKKEIDRWLRSIGREWREDESNLDMRFSRNRVRWMLLPEMRRVFGDSVIDRLRHEAEIFAFCAEFLEATAQKLFKSAVIARYEGVFVIKSSEALETTWGFGEIIRQIAIELDEPLANFDFDTVSRLYRACTTARKGRRFPVTGNLHIEIDGELIIIFPEILEHQAVSVELPYSCDLPNGMGRIEITENGGGIPIPTDGSPLILRPARSGDRIDPEHKLRRFLARKQVPRLLRDVVPVLFSGDRPIYSPLIGAILPEPALFEIHVRYDGYLDNILSRKGV